MFKSSHFKSTGKGTSSCLGESRPGSQVLLCFKTRSLRSTNWSNIVAQKVGILPAPNEPCTGMTCVYKSKFRIDMGKLNIVIRTFAFILQIIQRSTFWSNCFLHGQLYHYTEWGSHHREQTRHGWQDECWKSKLITNSKCGGWCCPIVRTQVRFYYLYSCFWWWGNHFAPEAATPLGPALFPAYSSFWSSLLP